MSFPDLEIRVVGEPMPAEQREGAVRRLESLAALQLPKDYADFLVKFGTSIQFDEEVVVDCDDPVGSDRGDRLLSVDGLLGLALGAASLDAAWHTYGGRLPAGVFPLSIDMMDNLLVLDTRAGLSAVRYWDHEEEVSGPSLPKVCAGFTELLQRLCRDGRAEPDLGEVEVEWHVDPASFKPV